MPPESFLLDHPVWESQRSRKVSLNNFLVMDTSVSGSTPSHLIGQTSPRCNQRFNYLILCLSVLAEVPDSSPVVILDGLDRLYEANAFKLVAALLNAMRLSQQYSPWALLRLVKPKNCLVFSIGSYKSGFLQTLGR